MSEQPSNTSDELRINRHREPIFRRYVYHILSEVGSAKERELINSGAEVAKISPVTAKRYLEKMCSEEGKCEGYRSTEFGHYWMIRFRVQNSTSSTIPETSS